MTPSIHPSILSADFANLEAEINRVSSADVVHVDVMDNHFVPNLTLGLPIVERLQQVSALPLDVHLMITDADRWAPQYADTGVYSVTFHAEAAADPVGLARTLRSVGARAGIAVKPDTPVEQYLEVLGAFDMILIMTVEPGFGGQRFLERVLPKLRATADAVQRSGLDIRVQVDGGINESTIGIAAEHGATSFVAGSSIFGAPDAAAQIRLLRDLATSHSH